MYVYSYKNYANAAGPWKIEVARFYCLMMHSHIRIQKYGTAAAAIRCE